MRFKLRKFEHVWREKARAELVSVNFGCFSPSIFSTFHYNAVRKPIKAHKNLHTSQQNEHTPGEGKGTSVW